MQEAPITVLSVAPDRNALTHLVRAGRGAAMSSMAGESGVVVGGVDTHSRTHHASVIDHLGREMSDCEFPATMAGYEALTVWLQGFDELARVGVEGTSSYGAGLAPASASGGGVGGGGGPPGSAGPPRAR